MSDVSELETQRTLGQLEGTVAGMGERIKGVETKVDGIDAKLDAVLQNIANQQGASKVRLWIGGVAISVLSATVSALMQWFKPH